MGPKGIQTRRRLLDATARLLDSAPLRELTVAQIIRASGVSAGTFYVYFPEVSDAVLAVIGEVTQSPPGLLALFDDPWPTSAAFERSHEFVATYVENVQRHASVFRVRNLASDEGDDRFLRLRLRAAQPLIAAIAARIEQRQASGELPRELYATLAAGALLAMIERIAVLRLPHPREKVTRSTLMHVAAYLTERLLADGAPADRRWVAHTRRRHSAPAAAGAALPEDEPRSNLHGQAMGPKGVQTRRRLLEATYALLRTKPLRELAVADITQAAGTATSTFYLYFEDVPEAVLAVIALASRLPAETLALFSSAASEGSAAAAENFCHHYIEWCRANAAILRVRSLAADEGDERFQRSRAEALEPVVVPLTERIAASQAHGGLPGDLHAKSAAVAFMAMIERLAVAPHYHARDLTPGTVSLVSAYVLSLLTPRPAGAT